MSDIDFAALIDPVARKLWGEPNTALSSTKNLRWGTHGSKSVDLGRGVWHDHESNEGGGTLDLVKRETGHADKDAVTWLEGEGFIMDIPLQAASPQLIIMSTKPARRCFRFAALRRRTSDSAGQTAPAGFGTSKTRAVCCISCLHCSKRSPTIGRC
jgi:hypothetical protein